MIELIWTIIECAIILGFGKLLIKLIDKLEYKEKP